MRLRLLAKMILCILLPTVAGFTVLSGVTSYLGREGVRDQINASYTEAAALQARELQNILLLLNGAVGTVADASGAQHLLAAAFHGDQEAVARLRADALGELKSLDAHFVYVRDIGLLDAKGRVLAHTESAMQGKDFSGEQFFREGMQGKESMLTSVDRGTGQVGTIITCPVKEGNVVIGVISATVDMPKLAEATTDHMRIGETGRCFVLDKAGIVVLHRNRKLVGMDVAKLAWGREVVDHDKGHIAYVWDGVENLGFYDLVPLSGWSVVVAVEERDAFASIQTMTRVSLLVSLAVALTVGLIIFIIARRMARTMGDGAALAQYVADGNLNLSPAQQATLDKACQSGDETGSLFRALRVMVGNLAGLFTQSEQKTREAETATREAHEARSRAEQAARQAEQAKREGMLAAAGQLEGAVEIINSASTQLAAQIEQSERGASEQAARVMETATAMEEMNSTVLEVARNAAAAAEVSLATRQKAETGAQVVNRAVDSIQQVRQQALQLKKGMTQLGENAQAITQIMGVISDIADQTNLLALNAAIEAARAGEAGRGFAVVADEVRKLAEKTMASTTDVGNAIKAIQQSAAQSIEQVDTAAHSIEAATDSASESGLALKEIVTLVDNNADQVRAIATASEQQSASSEEINQSITGINTIAGETARAMQEASRAVSDLAGQAQVLSSLISDMKRG